MKGVRITGIVFASIATALAFMNLITWAIFASVIPLVGMFDIKNVIAEEAIGALAIICVAFTIVVILYLVAFLIAVADVILLSANVKNAFVLVLGIISILSGMLVTGVLMCVYFGLAQKEKKKLKEAR